MTSAAGIDPVFYLNIKDPLTRALIDRIVDEVMEHQKRRDENLATLIINRLSEALRR